MLMLDLPLICKQDVTHAFTKKIKDKWKILVQKKKDLVQVSLHA